MRDYDMLPTSFNRFEIVDEPVTTLGVEKWTKSSLRRYPFTRPSISTSFRTCGLRKLTGLKNSRCASF